MDIADKLSSDRSIPLVIQEFDTTLDPNDLFMVGDAFLDEKGLVGHHIDSANAFYSTGIKNIITKGFNIRKVINQKRSATEEDRNIDRIECEVKFTDVRIHPPTQLAYLTNIEEPLYPNEALLKDKNYSGTLFVNFDVEATAYLKSGAPIKRTDTVKNFRIIKIPIVKGSMFCNTYNKTSQELEQVGEDPADPGGQVIAKHEYAIDSTESTTFNQIKAYINEGYGKSRIRADFLSKPGDGQENSDMAVIVFNNDDTLTVEIARNRLLKVQIPFYLLFRALGWNSDKEIIDHIVMDPETDANKGILNYIIDAFNAKYKTNTRDVYGQNEALREIVNLVPEVNFAHLQLHDHPENIHNAIDDVRQTIDQYFLPHIGLTAEFRRDKMEFLALMIRKVMMVYLRHIPQTDRDSYRIKRIHAAGDNLAKTFKQMFNQTAALPIKKQMTKVFNATPFSQVNLGNLVRNAIYAEDFERLMVQTITNGNKSQLKIKRKLMTNRMPTQQLHRKNQLNSYATMRQVSSTSADSAKQSERAAEMRGVHMSALGYICVVHSPPEGEKVGINKQMAIFASIAPPSSSAVLKRIVLDDADIVHKDSLTPLEIYRQNYAAVYVNGDLIAYTKSAIALAGKYRHKRRVLEINPFTTVYFDNTQNELQLFVDIGRMTRPLTIVYNNYRDKDAVKVAGKFQQFVAITSNDIIKLKQKTKSIYDLVLEQKVEFITPEEQQNCYICPSLRKLLEASGDDLNQYTHCDIPQAILGITALTAPFGNHNQAPRVTYQTSQAKQTCGYYVGNWPNRVDKEAFLQYINDVPLVQTAVNKYVFANGNMTMVAMMCYTGYNQEDSTVFSRASIDRGLFNGCKFDYEKQDLEQKEELGVPDASKTDSIKSANYSKLVAGVVQPGTLIEENDVLIGKYLSVGKTAIGKNQYIDRSVVYNESEPAIVSNVVLDRNEDGLPFVKVGLRKIRPLTVGDKLCLTPDHEVFTISGWIPIGELTKMHRIATVNTETLRMEYAKPSALYSYEHEEPIYEIHTQGLSIAGTLNHRMFVKRDGAKDFRLIEAREILDQEVTFTSKIVNTVSEANEHHLYIKGIPILYKEFLETLGAFLVDKDLAKKTTYYQYMEYLHIGDDIPAWMRPLSKANALHLLNALESACIAVSNNEPRILRIMDELRILGELGTEVKGIGKLVPYKGLVHCLEVPNHTFIIRRNGYTCITGNSSRSGQKGIASMLLRESDMPFTADGMRPDILFNPHGLPSRMTCAQLIESLIGNVCALRGTHYDGTMFNPVDIETFASQLESLGMHRYGYTRMFSGMTGEYIDTLIFYGPTYYQRLQKFVLDAEYSVRRALTDAMTHQPLEGQAIQGGLRLGEMERDVLCSHGASLSLYEKFFNHSDGYTEYICRCGKPAIANKKERLFKCKICKDLADIVAVPTSWTSKLFMQEMMSCNVGIRRLPRPFCFPVADNEHNDYSTFERYNEETMRRLRLQVEDAVGDSGARVENDE